MIFREATINDIEGLSSVRMLVQENVLNNPALVTQQDYENYLTTHGKGWLCEINNEIIGFAIADTVDNNIWALFVTPGYDKRGIGKELHRIMMNWYFSQGKDSVWLSTAPHTRAAEFYSRLGWTAVGMHGNELKFEMSKSEWININR